MLAACRRAALDWSELITGSASLELYQRPDLDIVSYFPATDPPSLSAIDQACARMLTAGMTDASDPVFLSALRVPAAAFARRHRGVEADQDATRILRSVLMKPEQQRYVPVLHARLERLARP